MTGQGRPVLYRLDGGVYRPAGFVSKHHDQRRIEHLHGVFQAGDHFITREIAGDAETKQVAVIFGNSLAIGTTT
jgi:hypothetical protein